MKRTYFAHITKKLLFIEVKKKVSVLDLFDQTRK